MSKNDMYSDNDMINGFMSLFATVLDSKISRVTNLGDRVILTGGTGENDNCRHLYLQVNKGEPRIFQIMRTGFTYAFFVDEEFVIYNFLQAIADKGLITLPPKNIIMN